jgi:hypothetical protein
MVRGFEKGCVLVLGALLGAAGCGSVTTGASNQNCDGASQSDTASCTGGQAGSGQGGSTPATGGASGAGGPGGSPVTPCTSIAGVEVMIAQDTPVAPGTLVSVQANCPPGKLALGGGAQFVDVAGATKDGMLISSVPVGGPGEPPTGWLASGSTQYHATNKGGLGESDQLVVYAICAAAGVNAATAIATEPFPTSPPQKYVSGKIDCPSGKTALGGGIRLADANGPKDGFIMRSMPEFNPGAPPTGWVATGSISWTVTNGNGPADRIDIQGVCAGVCPEAGVEAVPSLSPSEMLEYHAAQADCPPGKVAIGGGVRFAKDGTTGDGMVMRSMPVFTPGAPPTGWVVAGTVQYSSGGPILGDYILAYAVCAAVLP